MLVRPFEWLPQHFWLVNFGSVLFESMHRCIGCRKRAYLAGPLPIMRFLRQGSVPWVTHDVPIALMIFLPELFGQICFQTAIAVGVRAPCASDQFAS